MWLQVDDAVSADVEQTVVSLSASKMDEVSNHLKRIIPCRTINTDFCPAFGRTVLAFFCPHARYKR